MTDKNKDNQPAKEIAAPAAGATKLVKMGLDPKNRIAAFIEDVLFEPADSRVYEPKEGSGSQRRSKKVASVACVLVGGQFAIPGTIYLVQDKPNAKKYAEFSLVGSRQVQALKALDQGAIADLAAFRKWVADRYAAMRAEWARAGVQTAVKATATVIDDADEEF